MSTSVPVAFDPYAENRKTGSFIIIDRFTNRTVGAGMIAFGLRRGTNIHWQPLLIGKAERAALKHQKPAIVWFTGLSGAGKSTIANIVEQRLHARRPPHHAARRRQRPPRAQPRSRLHRSRPGGEHPPRRRGRQADGRSRPDRAVLVHLALPRRARHGAQPGRRRTSSSRCSSTPRSRIACERDPKGLYAKAKAGKLKNFTGVDAPYEAPEHPEIHLRTMGRRAEDLAAEVLDALVERTIIASV